MIPPLRLVACLLALHGATFAIDDTLPRVHLLATGGTIAGGASGKLSAEDLVNAVPRLASIASITLEDYVRISSSQMTPKIQLGLAQRVNQLFREDAALAGIVITHGTDSLEETAFFVDLLLDHDRPVVFAAAQRPPRLVDTDGPRNLINAVTLAASEATRGLGVMVTLNDQVHAARDVRKTHSTALEAFVSPGVGPLGYLDEGNIYLQRKPLNRIHISTNAIEAKVDIVSLVAGSDGHLIRAAIAAGARGLIIEVFGRGNAPGRATTAIREAIDAGLRVVFVTRTGGGRVILYPPFDAMGVLAGEDLDALKARIVLVVSLPSNPSPADLRNQFQRLSGLIVDPRHQKK